MTELSKHIGALSLERKCDFYLDCLDIIVDDESDKYERCMIRLHPEQEPIEMQCDADWCSKCMVELTIDEVSGYSVCRLCGYSKPKLIFMENYKDMKWGEYTGYLYKRITHFRKHWRDLSKKIGELRIDGYTARAEMMFNIIQPLFNKYKSDDRKNFFNYQYVLIKMCELFQLPDVRAHLTYLKSKEKLAAHDVIWKEICDDTGWTFISSNRLIEHKRVYKKRKKMKCEPPPKKQS